MRTSEETWLERLRKYQRMALKAKSALEYQEAIEGIERLQGDREEEPSERKKGLFG